MKKVWRTVIICALVYVLSFGATAVVMGTEPMERDVVTADITADAVSEESVYMVKAHNGMVAVFIDGEPVVVTEIPVSGLRQTDRALIEQGITSENYTDVLGLLEDFGS